MCHFFPYPKASLFCFVKKEKKHQGPEYKLLLLHNSP